MYVPVDAWFRAFLITLVVETPVVVLLLRRWEPVRARLVALALFANLASHPAVWFVFTQQLTAGTPTFTVVVETWAVACEAVFYLTTVRGLSARWAVTASLVANMASWGFGHLVFAVWPDLGW